MFEENPEHNHRCHPPGMHRRNWVRHNAMVPKGFIRFHVLEAMSEKPVSGSEIAEQIQKHAGGFWKPSPGSIYPLLGWLQENDYIKELPLENGLKRYELNENGKALFEEQKKMRQKVREQIGFLPAPFFERFLTKMAPEKDVEVRNSVKRLALMFFQLGNSLQENFSEQTLEEALEVVNEAANKLERLNKKLEEAKGEKNESNQST